MSRKTIVHKPSVLYVAALMVLASSGGAFAQFFDSDSVFGPLIDGCCWEKCPPPYVHCQDGPPCIKFKCGCPKPVCDPCNLRSWGYYENPWHPWPYPPNWSRCRDLPPVPHPAMMVGNPGKPIGVETQLPPPKRQGE